MFGLVTRSYTRSFVVKFNGTPYLRNKDRGVNYRGVVFVATFGRQVFGIKTCTSYGIYQRDPDNDYPGGRVNIFGVNARLQGLTRVVHCVGLGVG